MSISRKLIIKTDRTTDEVVGLLSKNLPFVEHVDEHVDTEEDLIPRASKWKSITTTNKATNFTIMDGSIGRDIIEDVFGFTPDLKLIFEMRTDENRYDAGMKHLFQTTTWMLEYFPGDAVLMFGDSNVMRRKDGKILLSRYEREAGNWPDSYLEYFTLPYEWAAVPREN